MSRDFSLDEIGRRLSGEGLSEQEQILAADDKVRFDWVLERAKRFHWAFDIGASDGSLIRALGGGNTYFAVERHPAHREALSQLGCWTFFGDALDAVHALPSWQYPNGCVAVCAEMLEHCGEGYGLNLLQALRHAAPNLIVTVPNSMCASYMDSGRSRRDWPDHQQTFDAPKLRAQLERVHWIVDAIEPIVGTLTDSVWIGASCHRDLQ